MSSEISRASSIITTERGEVITSNQPVDAYVTSMNIDTTDLTAVSLQISRSLQLPVEVYEHIIDWIVILTGSTSPAQRREMVERLSTSSLVCRAWRIRAQAHLFKKVSLKYEGLVSLDTVLCSNHAICPIITEMYIARGSKTNSISLFAIRHKLSNLIYLDLDRLDLTREHRWLHRAPLFHTVQRLRLYRLQTCQLSQLILFVNSFPSLTRLDLIFDFYKLEHKNQILPQPSHINTRSLKRLQLDLIPGVSRLIDWFCKAKPLLSQLTTLILHVFNSDDEVELISSFKGVRELLCSHGNSIEDLRLHLGRVPIAESVSDIGQHILSLLGSTDARPQSDWIRFRI